MKSLISLTLAALLALTWAGSAFSADLHEHNKVVCYWNTTSFERTGPAKFTIDEVKPALALCTHLIYGFAGINGESSEIVPLNPNLDTGAGYAYYRLVPQLKRQFPELKIYLSVGGNADPDEEPFKYLTLTELATTRSKFINSVIRLLNDYDFDGIDLAWQFPQIRVKKERSTLGSIWHGFKSKVGLGKFKDEKADDHRTGFTDLVRDLKAQLKTKNKDLTIAVLPHVNASVYYDVRTLSQYIDAVHLFTFDHSTPLRTPKVANYPAPIKGGYDYEPETAAEPQAKYWKDNGTPASKIVVTTPTFARTWALGEDVKGAGVPPVEDTAGPGPAGPQTNIAGLLSYPEVCARLTEHTVGRLRRVNDPSLRYGSYAWQPYDKKSGTNGIWVGFVDPETVSLMTKMIKTEGLGGIAIYDLSLDDFRGVCNGDKFPIVKGAKYKL